nr:hypothetical protein [Pandoravirus aubagnensis]
MSGARAHKGKGTRRQGMASGRLGGASTAHFRRTRSIKRCFESRMWAACVGVCARSPILFLCPPVGLTLLWLVPLFFRLLFSFSLCVFPLGAKKQGTRSLRGCAFFVWL